MASNRGKQARNATQPTRTSMHDEPDADDDDDRSSDSDFDVEKSTAVEVSEDDSEDDERKEQLAVDISSSKRKRADDDTDSSRKRAKADDDGENATVSGSAKKKRQPRPRGKVTFADLDSGDEATINQGGSRSKRGHNRGITIDEYEEGGEGGWVKTRSQRALETEEDRPLMTSDGATINVDEVWSRLAALPVGRAVDENKPPALDEDEADFITIKRTTRFAGEVTTEERRVHKDSAEAKLYLENQKETKNEDEIKEPEQDDASTGKDVKMTLRRPLKRLSRFEANPTGEVKALPPHLQLRWPRNKTAEAAIAQTSKYVISKGAPAAKINTVDKSRQDWAGFVDKSGIAEELDQYGKSKATYLGRQDFLNRTENQVEQGLRAARQKG